MARKLSPAQLAYLKLRREISRRRLWLWKNKRQVMEKGRVKATARANEVRQDINAVLLETVRTWQETMTPEQLDTYLLTLPYYRKGKKRRMRRDSLIRRLRLLNLIAYVPKANTWLNLCTLPQSKPSAPSEPNDEGSHQ